MSTSWSFDSVLGNQEPSRDRTRAFDRVKISRWLSVFQLLQILQMVDKLIPFWHGVKNSERIKRGRSGFPKMRSSSPAAATSSVVMSSTTIGFVDGFAASTEQQA